MRIHDFAGRVEAACDLTAALLWGRRSATRRSSDRTLSQLARDVARGQVKACDTVLRIALGAIADGADRADVEQFGHTYLAIVGAQYPTSTRSLAALHEIETGVEHAQNVAQIRQMQAPSSKAAKLELLRCVVTTEHVCQEMKAAIARETYGAPAATPSASSTYVRAS